MTAGLRSGASRLGTIARWIGQLGAGRATSVARVVRERGGSRELVGWLDVFGSDVVRAWNECPRGAFALELAALAGVDRALVAAAVRDCLAEIGEDIPRDVAASAERATASFAAGTVSIEAWRDAIESALSRGTDADPDVAASAREVAHHHRWGRRDDMLLASERYDAAYAAARRRFATKVRQRISADAVKAALEGLKAHPYR